MYGGSIAITKSDPSRELFFMFKPVMNSDAPTDELTIFLNGGPGCSSMDAFFQENGPFVWLPGTFLPTPNDYTWANITNMLWVDQPVGTGFATGKITATSQFDIAADFVSWFKNFEQTFGIKARLAHMLTELWTRMLTYCRTTKYVRQRGKRILFVLKFLNAQPFMDRCDRRVIRRPLCTIHLVRHAERE